MQADAAGTGGGVAETYRTEPQVGGRGGRSRGGVRPASHGRTDAPMIGGRGGRDCCRASWSVLAQPSTAQAMSMPR